MRREHHQSPNEQQENLFYLRSPRFVLDDKLSRKETKNLVKEFHQITSKVHESIDICWKGGYLFEGPNALPPLAPKRKTKSSVVKDGEQKRRKKCRFSKTITIYDADMDRDAVMARAPFGCVPRRIQRRTCVSFSEFVEVFPSPMDFDSIQARKLYDERSLPVGLNFLGPTKMEESISEDFCNLFGWITKLFS